MASPAVSKKERSVQPPDTMKLLKRNTVRIIKRRDIDRAPSTVDDSRDTAEFMERTVRLWIQEVRMNQAVESRRSFNKFFGKKNRA